MLSSNCATLRAPGALAVAWVLANPLVTSALLGARSVAQFDDSMQCLDYRLGPDERAAITALSVDPPQATDREPMAAMNTRGW